MLTAITLRKESLFHPAPSHLSVSQWEQEVIVGGGGELEGKVYLKYRQQSGWGRVHPVAILLPAPYLGLVTKQSRTYCKTRSKTQKQRSVGVGWDQ